ncbi:ribosomal protein S18-alanine N-acetyltransferase [Shewanella surugensis]|uniref:Ribosomal protein S18-alanine N-acetyltransferase n=1 Tax=Shewanella surugensis TaxID=212020 RepID=A0ABT0LBY6_9GAMM|nr:ribosomal protein S18-alanine N-acetyltransferase [Shewanella surugensis]MCL1125201.1 ribosomal protein S18-alanine N-acetyltransferase [Shewanella surugensis]
MKYNHININIKPMRRTDAPEMAALAKQAHTHPMSEQTIESCFGPLYRVSGIYADEVLAGFAITHQIFEEASLMDICIAPKSQGQGLGKALLTSVIDTVKTHDADVLLLEVRASSTGARQLYLACGFEQTGVRAGYYKTVNMSGNDQAKVGVEDAILMQLDISAR